MVLVTAAPLLLAVAGLVHPRHLTAYYLMIAFGGAQAGGQAHRASPDPHQPRDRARRCGQALDGDGPGSS